MNSKIKAAIITLALIATVGMTANTFISNGDTEKTNNAYVHGEITQISAEASGRITKIFVTDNQMVEAGELLAVIDPRDYTARRDQAKATLAMTTASLDSNKSRTALQHVNIDETAAHLEVAKATHDFEQKELVRYAKLVKTDAVSKTQHDAQANKTRIASANLEAAKFKLSAAKQQLINLESERTQILAQQQQAQASLSLAELALQDTQILAPISGRVGNRALQLGKFVNAGSGVLAIVPTDELWIEANFKETQLTNIQPGQAVDVVLDMFPDSPLKGTVSSTSPSTGAQFSLLPPDNATGNFVKVVQRVPVKIKLTIPQALKGRVVPGLSAEVSVNTDSIKS
ncbi:HlyD family secretion protein [Shewanella sp. Isolate13]|uniref:HlyD family secretion protein n=1 Tax=Shewanella sp. Isolate13 TaxID=2908531 RepID=UPI001EFCC0C7|nr:HlyD family secretion protein [Shewanella sp. Isolate13]MCG9730412.1 HlyD family secretion protein [Shewanella sp. Isolate13]